MPTRTVLIRVVVLALGLMGFALDNIWFGVLAGLGGCWLLADAVARRVDSVRLSRIVRVSHHLRRPRRRVAVLRVETADGRRLTFSELGPQAAASIARRIASR